VTAGAKLVWNVSLIRQVWLEDVFGVGFDLMKKVVIGGTEQVLDGWDVITAVPEPFGLQGDVWVMVVRA